MVAVLAERRYTSVMIPRNLYVDLTYETRRLLQSQTKNKAPRVTHDA